MGPDIAEIEAIIAYIEAHPQEWDQSVWARKDCGTAYCVAGHAVIRAGATIVWGTGTQASFCDLNGRQGPIDVIAQELLGLSDFDAEALFAAENEIADLRMILGDIASGEIG